LIGGSGELVPAAILQHTRSPLFLSRFRREDLSCAVVWFGSKKIQKNLRGPRPKV
jgi:hypothetical protein